MRLLVAAGASGGGVYPALAVLQELEGKDVEVLWVGSDQGIEEDLVSRAGFNITSIPAAGLHGVGVRAFPRNLIKIIQGIWAARTILANFQPNVLFFTGGFVAAPFALLSRRIPSLAFVPDLRPGLTLRIIAPLADKVALVASEAQDFFRNAAKTVVTGYPVRKEIQSWTRNRARKHFKLEDGLKTLFVFGGSKGAQSINEAILGALPSLLTDMQIIHLTGEGNWSSETYKNLALPDELASRYHAYAYLHDEIGAAMACADLVLSRGGASTIGEFPMYELPAILVPIPMSGHIQHLNAAFLEKSGAALVLPDEQMSEKLSETVLSTIHDEALLAQMGKAMKSLVRQDAAPKIAQLILDLGHSRQKEIVA